MYNTLFKIPLYNLFVWLIGVTPELGVGVAIILFTLAFKIVLLPLAIKATRTQVLMKYIQPKLKELKEKYKDDQQELGKKMMALYSEYKVNPFSSIMIMFIQLPAIFALFYILKRSGLPNIVEVDLYDWNTLPEIINMSFLWVKDITHGDYFLSALAALASFGQMWVMSAQNQTTDDGKEKSPTEEAMQSMMKSMKYVFPILAGVISYQYGAGLALYWIVSSLFAVGQELLVKRRVVASLEAEISNKKEITI